MKIIFFIFRVKRQTTCNIKNTYREPKPKKKINIKKNQAAKLFFYFYMKKTPPPIYLQIS